MKKHLTPRQKDILKYIQDTIRHRGYPPTLREIGQAMGISSLEGVSCHLNALEKKGHIKRDATHRGIKVLSLSERREEKGEEILMLPLVGKIAAGEPVLAEQNIEDWIPLPQYLIRGYRNSFLLKVKGDSMREDHILEGDLIVVAPQVSAENGEVVVAVINGEATVKRFYWEKDQIRLQPANPNYKPIILKRDFQICGKVIGLLRLWENRYDGRSPAPPLLLSK